MFQARTGERWLAPVASEADTRCRIHAKFTPVSQKPFIFGRVNPDRPPAFTRRRALQLIAAAAGACVADAAWIEPGFLSVTRRDISCADLPTGLDGLRIAMLADFHFKPGLDDALLEKIVVAVRREEPDLIALAGDFVDHDLGVLTPLLERLREMDARHGVFAVMGNHDGWAGTGLAIQRQFERAGISFLINEAAVLSIRGDSLAVAGTDFVWRGKPDPERTLRGIPPKVPILALVHEPDYFDEMTARRDIMLQLSGHTHGGQCRVPVLGATPVTPKWGRKYVYGDFRRGASQLFVTRGIGTTGMPVRFACPPELAMLTLRAAG